MTETIARMIGWAGIAAIALVIALGLVGLFVEPRKKSGGE